MGLVRPDYRCDGLLSTGMRLTGLGRPGPAACSPNHRATSTRPPFPGNLTPNTPSSGWSVIEALSALLSCIQHDDRFGRHSHKAVWANYRTDV